MFPNCECYIVQEIRKYITRQGDTPDRQGRGYRLKEREYSQDAVVKWNGLIVADVLHSLVIFYFTLSFSLLTLLTKGESYKLYCTLCPCGC